MDNHIKLKNKTPSNYYSEQVDDKEQKRRIDEAFGPKTDFSISNYENNYDKFNKEEKEMFTQKMQVAFNKKGYTDKDGFKLKTDGILGEKTKGVLDAYKRDNQEDYRDALKLREINYSEIFKELDNKIGKAGMSETEFNRFSGQQNQDNIETVAFKNSEDKSLTEWLYKEKNEEKYKNDRKEYITKLEDMVKGLAGYMKNNIPFNAVISKDDQRRIWEAGADLFLENTGNHISAWMLKHSLKDNPEKVVRGNDSYIANKIQVNEEYQRALNDKIKSSKNGIINETLENVDLSGDHDLYFSINKAKIAVDGYREENGDWIIKTTVTDTYDFTEFLFLERGMSSKRLLGTLANNGAYISQIMEAITPYEIEITFYTRRKGNEII